MKNKYKLTYLSKKANPTGFNGFFNALNINKRELTDYFSIDELPYCCGVFEIGNFKEKMTQEMFNYVIDFCKTTGYYFIINNTKETDYNNLILNSERFKKIHEFINPNTENLIDIYVLNY